MAHQPADGDPYGFLSYTTADRARVLALADRLDADVEAVNASPFRHWAHSAHEQSLALSRAGLSAEAFAQAWSGGQSLSLDQVADLALAAGMRASADTNPALPPILGAADAVPQDVNADHAD